MNYILLLKAIAGGIAAVGFAILFNTNKVVLFSIFLMGSTGVLLKLGLNIALGANIIITTFIGASANGFIGYIFGIRWKKPPLIISIPSVIPMVPGIFLYRMMIGIVRLASNTTEPGTFNQNLMFTVSNGSKAIFIVMGLAIGISLPYLVFRRNSLNYLDVNLKPKEKVKQLLQK